MNGLVLYWGQNTPGKSDLSVFQGGARVYSRLHSIASERVVPIDVYRGPTPVPPGERMRQSFGAVEALPQDRSLATLAIFSHGFRDRLGIGFTIRNVDRLAALLATRARRDLHFIYYACSTGGDLPGVAQPEAGPGGEGGFLDASRDAFCRAGLVDCVGFGHDRSAHAYFCPFVTQADGAGSTVGGFGNRWLVEPRLRGSHADRWKWRAWLWCMQTKSGREANPRLWARFPHMTDAELDAELRRFCKRATGAEAP